MPADNDNEFKSTVVTCSLKYDAVFPQMGSDSSPFPFTKTIIWSYQIYGVNRFIMIINT